MTSTATPATPTITIKVPVTVTRRTYPKGWRATVGAHEAESTLKSAAIAAVRDVVAAALGERDVGKIARAAIVGDVAYALACGADGRWRCLMSGQPDALGGTTYLTQQWTHPDRDGVDAGARFERHVADVRTRKTAREDARPLSDETSRLLHILAAAGSAYGTKDGDDMSPRALASIAGYEISKLRALLEPDVLRARASTYVFACEGQTLEGGALGRLLGIDGAVDLLQAIDREAVAILGDPSTSKWSGTIADLRAVVGGRSALDVTARALEALDDPERRVMETGGPADDGPIAAHYEADARENRKAAQEKGIDAATTAWEAHVKKIRRACDALDDAITGLDIPDEVKAMLDEARDAVGAVFNDEPEEITVDD